MRLLSFSQRSLEESAYSRLLPSVVADIKPLDIACGFKQKFNPAWTLFKGELIGALRGANYGASPNGSFIGIFPVDIETYQPLESPTWLPIKEVSPEDPRLIEMGGRLWLFFNARSKRAFVKIFLCPLERVDGRWELAEPPVELVYEGGCKRRVEKNWMPFVHEEKLYLIYSLSPYVLLKADPLTGICTKIDAPPVTFPWDFGEPRGSAQLIPQENGYIGVFHSSKSTLPRFMRPRTKIYYYLAGFSIDHNLHLNSVSRDPFDLPGFYNRTGKERVIFTSGLIENGDKLALSAGIDDKRSAVVTINKSAFLETLCELK